MLHIDIETYSSEDLKSVGAYRYAAAIDFDILILAYAYGDEKPTVLDLFNGDEIPEQVASDIRNPHVLKCAHNAAFERVCLEAYGYSSDPFSWRCTATMAAAVGLPHSLKLVGKALRVQQEKLETGSKAIKFFCIPKKPTRKNPHRRNYPYHNPELWREFLKYCGVDVEAEQGIEQALRPYALPAFEWFLYAIDQKINDRGVAVDLAQVRACISADERYTSEIRRAMIDITGVENPNSLTQLKAWLLEQTGYQIDSLRKERLPELMQTFENNEAVVSLLQLRALSGKTSVKKYAAMLRCGDLDGRLRGLLLFMGAARTARWAGRIVQLHNLPRNKIQELGEAKAAVKGLPYEDLKREYPEISFLLSDLIRAALVASPGNKLVVVDYAAVEARVLSWLAGERWRLEVFETHGRIYEASASQMFDIPLVEITKESDYRAKGKVAELALGYQGSVGALVQMGALDMGLTEEELPELVQLWRARNPKIKKFWYAVQGAAIAAIKQPGVKYSIKTARITFKYDGKNLLVKLPSGRSLVYWQARIAEGKYGDEVRYIGLNHETKKLAWINTYGGKLTENITQAIARDLLAYALVEAYKAKLPVVLHVHDEIVLDSPKRLVKRHKKQLEGIMSTSPPWAKGLPLLGDGFVSDFYKK